MNPETSPKTEKKHNSKIAPVIIAVLIVALAVGLAIQHHKENKEQFSSIGHAPSVILSDAGAIPRTLGKDTNWLLLGIGINKPPNTQVLVSDLLNKNKKELRITSFNIIKNAGNLIDSSPAFDENGEPLLILPNPGDNGSITVTKKTLADSGVYDPPDPTEESWWSFDNIPANVPQPLPHAGYVFVVRDPVYPNPDGTPSVAGYDEFWENPDGSIGGLSFIPEDSRFISLVDLPDAPKDNSQYKNGKYMDAGAHIFVAEVKLSVYYDVQTNIVPLIVTDPVTGQQGIPER